MSVGSQTMTMQPNPQVFGYGLLPQLHAVWPLTLGGRCHRHRPLALVGRCRPMRLSLEDRRAHLDRHLPLVARWPVDESVVVLRAVRVVHECQAATVGAVVDAPVHKQVPEVTALPPRQVFRFRDFSHSISRHHVFYHDTIRCRKSNKAYEMPM